MSNLLEFSRKSGTATEKADLNNIVERTLFLIGHKLRLQEINLEKRFATDLPSVTCDAEQIQQALLAIFMNAMDAMPEGGTLEVETRLGAEMAEGEHRVEITVTDSGQGIPPEIVGRLFDPFFTTKRDKKSVGLGLSVVHGIVKSHHGTIDVVSKPGRTSFVITLPEHTDVREELFAAAAGKEKERS